MIIGSLQKFSLIDYPERLCATVFAQGCTFRCPYCHNPELVEKNLFQEPIPRSQVIDFLKTRRNKLEGVCITGGEPTLQGHSLIAFIEEIKELGFLVKLDTNGSRPTVLQALIETHNIDYIAMDIKAPLSRYAEVTRSPVDTSCIRKSIELILDSALDCEFRTTVVKSLLTPLDIEEIGTLITGAGRYILQKFIPAKTLNGSFMGAPGYRDDELFSMAEKLQRLIPAVTVR